MTDPTVTRAAEVMRTRWYPCNDEVNHSLADVFNMTDDMAQALADAGLLVTDEMAAVLAAAEAWVYPSYPLSVEDGHFLTHALIAAVDAWQAAKGGET